MTLTLLYNYEMDANSVTCQGMLTNLYSLPEIAPQRKKVSIHSHERF
jgi:hypothetical protein